MGGTFHCSRCSLELEFDINSVMAYWRTSSISGQVLVGIHYVK